MNGASDVNGKAPLNGQVNGNSRHSDGPLVVVQPPRREDLQPSYASVLKPDTEDVA